MKKTFRVRVSLVKTTVIAVAVLSVIGAISKRSHAVEAGETRYAYNEETADTSTQEIQTVDSEELPPPPPLMQTEDSLDQSQAAPAEVHGYLTDPNQNDGYTSQGFMPTSYDEQPGSQDMMQNGRPLSVPNFQTQEE